MRRAPGRGRPGAALLLLAALCAAPAARAQLDRPDLSDLALGASSFKYRSSKFFDTNSVVFTAVNSSSLGNVDQTFVATMYRQRSAYNSTRTSGIGSIRVRLYEPDKINRSANKNQLRQSSDALVYVYVTAFPTGEVLTQSTAFQFVLHPTTPPLSDGCQAQLQSKDKDGDGTHESFAWKALCAPAMLDQLGLTPQQRQALKLVFGTDKVIKAQGKE